MDQMLENLTGHNYYCLLDGYFGYAQITIAPKDKDKTTFTCPLGTFAFRTMLVVLVMLLPLFSVS